MTKMKWSIAAGLIAMSGAPQAGLSNTWTITNDDDLCGITQTAHDPTLPGSVDYACDGGLSVGAPPLVVIQTQLGAGPLDVT